MYPYAFIILVHIYNCKCYVGNAESGSKRFCQLLRTVQSSLWWCCSERTCHFHWSHPLAIWRREGSEKNVVSVECEKRFASKASKQGKILTISSSRTFLTFQSVRSYSVGRTFTARVGGRLYWLRTVILWTSRHTRGVLCLYKLSWRCP